MYKRSLINLFFKGYHGMLPSTLAEKLVINGERPSSRLKHGLIAPSFASKYVQNSISYRVGVLWNAIGRSNRSILESTGLKSFLKNVVNCRTFKDFNFNVLMPQIINKRSGNFIHFSLLTSFVFIKIIFCKNYFYRLIVVLFSVSY